MTGQRDWRTLVVFDPSTDSAAANALFDRLDTAALHPVRAHSCNELYRLLPHYRPDVILLAGRMQDTDCVGLLLEWRTPSHALLRTPVLVFGTRLNEASQDALLHAGAYDVFDPQEMTALRLKFLIERAATTPQRASLPPMPPLPSKQIPSTEPRRALDAYHLKAVIFDYDVVTGYVERSGALEALTGYTLEESQPTRDWWNHLIHPDDYDRMMAEYDSYYDESKKGANLHPAEYRILRKDGSVATVWSQSLLLRDARGTVIRVLGSTIDISERKAFEAVNRSWQQRYQLAAQAVQAIIYDYDTISGRVERTGNVTEMTGYTPEEVEPTAEWWHALVYPPDLERLRPIELHWFDDPKAAMQSGEYRIRHKDGRLIDVWDRSILIRDVEGRVIRMVGSTLDITARKQAERAERDQRQFAEAMANIALMLNSTLDLKDVLHLILNTIPQVIPHDAAYFLLKDHEILRLTGTRGFAELKLPTLVDQMQERAAVIEENPVFNQMQAHTEPVVLEDTQVTGGLLIPAHASPLHGYLGMPLVFGNEMLGILSLNSLEKGFFTPEHTARIQVFAAQAACAIHNAQLIERVQELATIQERTRIARDLHDSISQLLFSASLMSESVVRSSTGFPQISSSAAQLLRLNRAALAEMRKLVVEMRYSDSSQFNLSEMLNQLANAAMGHTDLDVQVKIEGEGSLPPNVRMTFYRIAQEALNNVIKHAHATLATLHLQFTSTQCVLTIRDFGRGFDTTVIKWSSTGLSNIRDRAHSIGAECEIQSEIGSGTQIIVRWSE
ncbi:MAG: PAS domain-containing protein [Anaerolineae bacterium]